MEQVYASEVPSIIKLGENIGPPIGIAIAFALIPIIVTYNSTLFRKIILYNLLIIMPLTIGFFSQYWDFINKFATLYEVAGINDTLTYSTVNNSCIIVVDDTRINSTCFAQNILTSLSYDGQIYVYGNYTNYYNIQPSIPSASSKQDFIPWAPTLRDYKSDSENNGLGLLFSLCIIYSLECLFILMLIGKDDEERARNIELTNYPLDRAPDSISF
jgi:hypothetical protein